MSDLEMWMLVVGFFSPVVISILQQPRWPDGLRAVVAFVFCAIVATVTYWLNGGVFDFENTKQIVTSALIVLVTTISTYKGFWKPTGISPAVESSTTIPVRHVAT